MSDAPATPQVVPASPPAVVPELLSSLSLQPTTTTPGTTKDEDDEYDDDDEYGSDDDGETETVTFGTPLAPPPPPPPPVVHVASAAPVALRPPGSASSHKNAAVSFAKPLAPASVSATAPAALPVRLSARPPRTQDRSLLSPIFPTVSSAQRVSVAGSAARRKVALEPGHSPLDWARLKSSGSDLKGTTGRMRLTLEEVAKHKSQEDAWTVLHGKVYNMSPYMNFHPGGIKQLMKGAGKDSTQLFMAIHAWVNAEYMLDACYIGDLER